MLLKLCGYYDVFSKLNSILGTDKPDAPFSKTFFETILVVLQAWALLVQLHYALCSLSAQRACARYDSSEADLQQAKKGSSRALGSEQLRYEKARALFQASLAKDSDAAEVPLAQYIRALSNDLLASLFTYPWVFVYVSVMGLWILFLVLFNNPNMDFVKKNVVFNNSEFLVKTVALSSALTLVVAARMARWLMSFETPFFKSAEAIIELVKVLVALNSLLLLGMGTVLLRFYSEAFVPVFAVSFAISAYLMAFAFPGLFNAIPYFVVVNLGDVDSRIMSILTKKNN